MEEIRLKSVQNIMIGLAMLLATGVTVLITPRQHMSDQGIKINLEKIIPRTFSDWHIDESIVPIAISSDIQARLDELYNQTLSRTYVNAKGERVMLSIAYGGDQSSDKNQVHRPEFCYRAQGFDLLSSKDGTIKTRFGLVPVRRLVARKNNRIEPITYWITVGDQATLPGLGRKLLQLKYGLTGRIPDGMLFRVSSLNTEYATAYGDQESFINELLDSVTQENKIRLIGKIS